MNLRNEYLLQFYNSFRDSAKRYTIFSDIHIPFEDEGLIKQALNRAEGDVLIIAGDLIDGYSASYYPKEQPITFEDEIEKCQEYMNKFAKRFDRVYICLGNHDYRIIKQLETLPFGIVSYVKHNVMDGFLKAIKVRPNIIVGSWWLLFLNDMAIGHADTYSKLPLRSLYTLQEYIAKVHSMRYHKLNAIFQGHTHHLGMTMNYGKILVQLPCMQGTANYRYRDKISGSINYEWHRGWVEIKSNKEGIIRDSIQFRMS